MYNNITAVKKITLNTFFKITQSIIFSQIVTSRQTNPFEFLLIKFRIPMFSDCDEIVIIN